MSNSKLALPELGALEVHGMTRSSFMIKGALAAGAVYGTSMITPFVSQSLAQEGGGDVEILNFALTLEYLETEFYVEGLKQVKGLSGDIKKLATEIRDNEQEHVDGLIAAIEGAGGKAVKSPKFDFAAAYKDEKTFLKFANILEDTGVSAYNGAGPAIESPDVLGAAGAIVQVEARHAALIRLARGKAPAPLGFDKSSDTETVLAAVKPFIKG